MANRRSSDNRSLWMASDLSSTLVPRGPLLDGGPLLSQFRDSRSAWCYYKSPAVMPPLVAFLRYRLFTDDNPDRDSIACAYGVLQFSADPVPTLNIRRMFHQMSSICSPYCHLHRYEYFATGIFSDLDQRSILQMFGEMEVCAQYVHSAQFIQTTDSYILLYIGNCAKITHSLSMTPITPGVSRFESQQFDKVFVFVIHTYPWHRICESAFVPDDDISAPSSVMAFIRQ